jgi:hypothetical protein
MIRVEMRVRPVPGRIAMARARATAVGLAVALSGWPAGAMSADDGSASAEPDLGELWREAQARMETSDYGGAIEALTRLYQHIASDPDAKILRLRVRWTLHEAHRQAYALEREPAHLLVAEDLLIGYLEDLGEGEGRLREKANEALEQVRAQLAEDKQRAAAEAEAARAAAEEAKRRAAEAERAEAEAERDEALADPSAPAEPMVESHRPARPFWIAGGVLTGLGGAGVGMAIGGFASASRSVAVFEREPDRREQARRDVRLGNTVGITGAIVGGALLATGVALLVIAKGRKRATTPVAAWLGPQGVGVSWRGRF